MDEEHPDVALLLLQVVQRRVKSYGDCTLCGPAWMICELEWVEAWREMVLDVLKNQPLKAPHDYHRTIIIQAGDGGLLWFWNDCS